MEDTVKTENQCAVAFWKLAFKLQSPSQNMFI